MSDAAPTAGASSESAGAAADPAGSTGLDERDLAAVDDLLRRAVARHAEGPESGAERTALLERARAALDGEILPPAAGAYADYRRATGTPTARREPPGLPLLFGGVSGLTAFAAELAQQGEAVPALTTGVAVAAVTSAAGGARHWIRHRAAVSGTAAQARARWLAEVERSGVRPFLDRAAATAPQAATPQATTPPAAAPQAAAGPSTAIEPPAAQAATAQPAAPTLAPATAPPATAAAPAAVAPPAATAPTAPPAAAPAAVPAAPPAIPLPAPPTVRRTDRSAAARQRMLLEQSFATLPEGTDPYTGRRGHLAQISQWVAQARASTETKPTVVVLHGPTGSGRSTLAARAARQLSDQFRGVCVVTLRGDPAGNTVGEAPLTTREALLHLLNRFGAPREQLLFRELPSRDQHERRLSEEYQKHLTGLPVIVILDDASDPEQVRALVPANSESLVLVTATDPMPLGPLDAWVRELPVRPLEDADAAELLRELAGRPADGWEEEQARRVGTLCAGLPLALRVAGSSLGERTPGVLADDLAAYGPLEPTQRALALRYRDLPGPERTLLRRLALAGRASLGAGAAAALLSTDETETARLLGELAKAGLIEHVRGNRYRLHEAVRAFAQARLLDEEELSSQSAARERLIRTYSELADSVLRLVDGHSSTRADAFAHGAVGAHGFRSLDQALRWLDEESSFITATVRGAEGVDTAAVLHLLGALCDYCLLRGDLYRLGEISDLTQAVDQGLLTRSVRWRTGIAARQLGDLDRARTTLASVVDLYVEAEHPVGAARALASLGITLHHQGDLVEAEAKLREALKTQADLPGDQGWTMHALAAVLRDQGRVGEAMGLLVHALELHHENESVRGQAWAHLQLGQAYLRLGDTGRAAAELGHAHEKYQLTRDLRGEAWSLTQLARTRLQQGEAGTAVAGLHEALARHRENEDVRGEAWTLYYLGQAQEESGQPDEAMRTLDRARTMFSRMRDGLGLACARHHLGRLTRDERARQVSNLRNSGFARQLLQDAHTDFRRCGAPFGQAWSCLELAVIDAANERVSRALALTEEAAALFAGLGDVWGEDWARFLRCTLLPLVSEGGAREAALDLAALQAQDRAALDPAVTEYAEAWAVVLRRGLPPGSAWDVWRLGMTPSRAAQDQMVLAPVPGD